MYTIPKFNYKILTTTKDSEDTQLTLFGGYGQETQFQKEIKTEPAGSVCWDHEWINVGFHHDKWVCKICNKDKHNE